MNEDYNEFNEAPLARTGNGAMTVGSGAAVALAAQTSQAAIQERLADSQMRFMMARQFPRDIVAIERNVANACSRFSLAQMAQYALPVSGSTVKGPSIRMAEVLAQAYGNLDIGREVVATGKDERGKWSDIRVYALDLETGLRFQETMRIHHVRYSKSKGDTAITDLSELERLFSQHAAKRLRECILRAIPRDLTEKALAWCRQTVQSGDKDSNGKPLKPLIDRCKAIVLEFERLGVKREQVEKYVGCAMNLWTPEHFEDLVSVWRSVKDSELKVEEFFGDPNATAAGDTAAKFRAQAAARKEGGAQ